MLETDVLVKPVISEKGSRLAESGRHVFVVHKQANKLDIKKAVEKVFSVKVVSVNTFNKSGKIKTYGRGKSNLPDTKRAVVKLAKGQSITLFEDK